MKTIQLTIDDNQHIAVVALAMTETQTIFGLLDAFLMSAKQVVVKHKCGDPTCRLVEITIRYINEIEAVRNQYMDNHADVDLTKTFVVARTGDGGIDTISVQDMIKAGRFNDLSQWFSIHCNDLVGIKEGADVHDSQYKNMIRFLKKNGAKLIDTEDINAQKITCESQN